jgi:hypothetical protein
MCRADEIDTRVGLMPDSGIKATRAGPGHQNEKTPHGAGLSLQWAILGSNQ